MSFGEKKVITLPNCVGTAITLTATVINEENIPLLETEPLDISLQPVSALKSQKISRASSKNPVKQSAKNKTH